MQADQVICGHVCSATGTHERSDTAMPTIKLARITWYCWLQVRKFHIITTAQGDLVHWQTRVHYYW
jgi:hypothetical protein